MVNSSSSASGAPRSRIASRPVGLPAGRSGLGEVSQCGDGTSPATASDHAQLHGGEVLGLVDDNVPVGLSHPGDEGFSFIEEGQVGTAPSLFVGPLGRRSGEGRRLLRI